MWRHLRRPRPRGMSMGRGHAVCERAGLATAAGARKSTKGGALPRQFFQINGGALLGLAKDGNGHNFGV